MTDELDELRERLAHWNSLTNTLTPETLSTLFPTRLKNTHLTTKDGTSKVVGEGVTKEDWLTMLALRKSLKIMKGMKRTKLLNREINKEQALLNELIRKYIK